MKIRTSYFYQIRNFTRNMLPMSTCLSDPDWYHDNQGKNHIYYDKRGILNGLRLNPVICQGGWDCGCPCTQKDPTKCGFLKNYKKALEQIDFDKMYKGIEQFAEKYKKENKIEEEIIMVLIVYEPPTKACSERGALIDYFNSKGIECKELDYPIGLTNIDKKDFDF